eukprot:scaffold311930_cov43-Tisochrysis_lutea.AAC.1
MLLVASKRGAHIAALPIKLPEWSPQQGMQDWTENSDIKPWHAFAVHADKKDKKDKEETAKPAAGAPGPSAGGMRGGATDRNASAAAALVPSGSALQDKQRGEQQLRGQASSQPPHTVVNMGEPEEAQVRAGGGA